MDYEKLALEFLGDFIPRRMPLEDITNLSKGEIGVIMTLNFHEDNLLAGEIAKHLKITSGRTASILKSLEKKEMILKSKCEKDARQTYILLTNKGREFAKEHSQQILNHFKSILEFLGEKDAKEFVRLNKLVGEYSERTIKND